MERVEVPRELGRNWGWLLSLGIVLMLFGCIGMTMVVGLTLASILFLGVLLVIGGFLQMIDAFRCKHWRAVIWHTLGAVLYIIAGVIVIYDPFLASTLITALLAGVLIVIGINRCAMAISLRHAGGWVWILLAGLTALVLGILILMQWPWSGLWIIGMFIAIEMLVTGWSYIFIAISLRSIK